MFQNFTIDLIVYIGAGVMAAGVIITAVTNVVRFIRRINTLVTQWLGNPDLGVPGMIDRLEDHARRLGEIEKQTRPVNGKTLRERIDSVERKVRNLEGNKRAAKRGGTGSGES